jgi:hypothetical protein
MGHPTRPENKADRPSRSKAPTGLGWSEFFHELGVGTQGEGGSPETAPAHLQERTLYASENGDRWSLVRETDSGRVLVRHQPNLASGGRASEMEVGAFLVQGGMGPEKQELLRLIGSAVETLEVSA